MKKILFILIVFFSLIFLIITTPLINFFIDKKLDNGDSVRALVKDIVSDVPCHLDIFGGLIETTDEDTQHEFICDNKDKNIRFNIYIFKTQAEKNRFIKDKTYRDIYSPCFKHGKYYVVCENGNWYTDTTTEEHHFNGAPYYHEFKSKDFE